MSKSDPQAAVDAWNKHYPPGTPVAYQEPNGDCYTAEEGYTSSDARLDEHRTPEIVVTNNVSGFTRPIPLARITRIGPAREARDDRDQWNEGHQRGEVVLVWSGIGATQVEARRCTTRAYIDARSGRAVVGVDRSMTPVELWRVLPGQTFTEDDASPVRPEMSIATVVRELSSTWPEEPDGAALRNRMRDAVVLLFAMRATGFNLDLAREAAAELGVDTTDQVAFAAAAERVLGRFGWAVHGTFDVGRLVFTARPDRVVSMVQVPMLRDVY